MSAFSAFALSIVLAQATPINEIPPPKDPAKCEKCAVKMTPSGMIQVCVPCDQSFPK
jgi:hypothetical protein